MRALIALKLQDDFKSLDGDFIGADKGALELADLGIHMKLAIGDFDSIDKADLKKIRAYADEVVELNPIKDDTDAEAAIHAAMDRGYDEIWLCGATGARMDHSLINLRIAMKYPGIIWLHDRCNLIHAVKEGDYTISKKEYPYISFFTDTKAVITLDGFAYPLDHRTLTQQDLYTVSNEITGDTGILHVHEGKVLVMQTKDQV